MFVFTYFTVADFTTASCDGTTAFLIVVKCLQRARGYIEFLTNWLVEMLDDSNVIYGKRKKSLI